MALNAHHQLLICNMPFCFESPSIMFTIYNKYVIWILCPTCLMTWTWSMKVWTKIKSTVFKLAQSFCFCLFLLLILKIASIAFLFWAFKETVHLELCPLCCGSPTPTIKYTRDFVPTWLQKDIGILPCSFNRFRLVKRMQRYRNCGTSF